MRSLSSMKNNFTYFRLSIWRVAYNRSILGNFVIHKFQLDNYAAYWCLHPWCHWVSCNLAICVDKKSGLHRKKNIDNKFGFVFFLFFTPFRGPNLVDQIYIWCPNPVNNLTHLTWPNRWKQKLKSSTSYFQFIKKYGRHLKEYTTNYRSISLNCMEILAWEEIPVFIKIFFF